MAGKPIIGRPRNPGTDAERAEARRAKVRVNVQAFRKRHKEKMLAANGQSQPNHDAGLLCLQEDVSGVCSLAASPSPNTEDPESDHVDPDSCIWQFSRDLSNDPARQDAFLSALQHHDIPVSQAQDRVVYEPCGRFSIISSDCIQRGSLEIGHPGLEIANDAVLASALTIIGRSRSDTDMILRGALVQSRALRELRITLQILSSEQEDVSCAMIPLQALTCAVSELLTNHDWANFASHLTGVGALIEHGGLESLRSRELREHFYGYRSLQAAFSIMHGHAMFLADREWIRPSWRHEIEASHHPLHTMLDIAFKLLPAMDGRNSHGGISESKERLQRLRSITSQLDEWERELTQKQGRLYNAKDAMWTGLYDYAFDFASLAIGVAFAMYAGVRVKLAWMVKEAMAEIIVQDPGASLDTSQAIWEALQWARQGLQSLEYFHTGQPKTCGKIVTLFPLDASWKLIADVHAEGRIDLLKERQWCLATAHRLSCMDCVVFKWR